MTYLSPLLIQIRSTSDGLYAWDLHDGPDGALHESGRAPTIDRCITEIALARQVIAHHITGDLDPTTPYQPHLPLHSHPTYIHTPDGHALPAQQDIPAVTHTSAPSAFIYLRPSSSG